MATTTELENLVVRMSADVENIMKGMDDVKKKVEKTTTSALDDIHKFKSGLQELGGTIAAVFGGDSILSFLRDSKQEWFASETAVFELNSVLRANGREIDELSDRYQAFASEVQKNTVYSDEHVLSLIQMAEQYDLTGREAERAVNKVLAFSKATDSGETMAFRVVKAMQEGDTEMAMMMSKRLGPFKGVKDEKQFEVMYQRMLTQGQEKLNKELDTGAGKVKNFENQFSDMQEEIGKTYTQVADPIKLIKKYSMELYGSMNASVKENTVLIISWGAQILVAAGSVLTLVKASQLLGVTWTNIKGIWTGFVGNPFAWAALAAVSIALLTAEIINSSKAMKDFKEAADRLPQAGQNLSDAIKERGDKFSKTGDAEAIKKEIDTLTKFRKQEEDRIEQIKKAKDEHDIKVGRGVSLGTSPTKANARISGKVAKWISKTVGLEDTEIQGLNKEQQMTEGIIGTYNEVIKKRQEDLDSLDKSQIIKANSNKYDALVNALDKQNKELGKTPEEIKLIELQATLSFEQIGNVYKKLQDIDLNKKMIEAKQGLASFIEELDNAAKARAARDREDPFYNEQLEKFSKNLTAAQMDIARFKNQQETIAKAVEEAENNTMTPVEKFEKEQRRLYDLLVTGADRWDLYEKAVDKAAEGLHEAAAAARDAAGAGSAEGLSRLIDYNAGTGKRGYGAMIPEGKGWNEQTYPKKAAPQDPIEKIRNTLEKMYGELVKFNNRPTVEAVPANLN